MAETREGQFRGRKRKRSEASELEIGLEEFLSRNSALHKDIWRLYELVKDLDAQSGQKMQELEEEFGKVKELACKGRRKKPSKGFKNLVQRLAARLPGDSTAIKNLESTKIAVAQQGYDLLDRIIRELDHRITMFDAAVDSNEFGSMNHETRDSNYHVTNPPALPQSDNGTCDRPVAANPGNPAPQHRACAGQSGGTRRNRFPSIMLGCHPLPLAAYSLLRFPGSPSSQQFSSILMRDDSEPMYCWCQQVAYGDMISCDNPSCPYEWFHYDCVGITEDNLPKCKWHCPYCRGLLERDPSRQ